MSQQLALFGQPAQTVSMKAQRESAAVEKRARQLFREWQLEYQPKISDMPAEEQPVNRIADFGPGALSSAELIAILLGGPYQLQQAASLLHKYDGLLGLARAPHHDCQLCKDTGQLVGSYVFCFCAKGRRMHRERYQETALDQARTLASGTIATLTGLERYEDIDATRARFVAFVADENPPDAFTCWQDAWDAFTEKED